MNKLGVLSVSGGMDSTGLILHMLNKGFNLEIVSFDYGQKHMIELDRLNKNIYYLKTKGFNLESKTLDLSGIMSLFHSALIDKSIDIPVGDYNSEDMKQTVVPNRNAIFSAIIYGYALSKALKLNSYVTMGLGVHSGDHTIYPDCRPEFFALIQKAFEAGNWNSEKVECYLPYINKNKLFILKDSLTICGNLGLDFDVVFSNTNTCYNPDTEGRSCGECGSCSERLEAFKLLGRKDPVLYRSNINADR